jgi:hypothetical protein
MVTKIELTAKNQWYFMIDVCSVGLEVHLKNRLTTFPFFTTAAKHSLGLRGPIGR